MKTILIVLSVLLIQTTAQAQSPEWQRVLSSEGVYNETTFNIKRDGLGNFIIQGTYDAESFELDGITVDVHASKPRTGRGSDYFIAKFNKDYEIVWIKTLEAVDSVSRTSPQTSFDVDREGYIYANFQAQRLTNGAAIIFGGDTLAINYPASGYWFNNIFAKMDPDGNVLWSKNVVIGGMNTGVYADNKGGCYYFSAIGNAAREIIIDSLVFPNPHTSGFAELFVCRLDPDGKVLWGTTGGGKYAEIIYDVDVDSAANLYFTGVFSSDTAVFGSHVLVNFTGGGSIVPHANFYTKLSPSGEFLWAKQAEISPGVPFYGCIVKTPGGENPAGDYYLTGVTTRNAFYKWDNLTVPKGGFYAKVNTSGDPIWIKSYTDSLLHGNIQNVHFEADRAGNMYILNTFRADSVLICDTLIRNKGSKSLDFCVVKIDDQANSSLYFIGGSDDNDNVQMTVWGDGNMALSGNFKGNSITFGDEELQNSDFPNNDLFLAFYASEEPNTGLPKLKGTSNVRLYPNPVRDELHIQSKVIGEELVIDVLDLQGNEVKKNVHLKNGKSSINLQGMSSGVYFVRVQGANSTTMLKFIKL